MSDEPSYRPSHEPLLEKLTVDETTWLRIAIKAGGRVPSDRAPEPSTKAARAWRALRASGELGRELSSWAANHLVGMLADGIDPWRHHRSIAGRKSRLRREYDPDDPNHELAGARIVQAGSPQLERKMLIQFLQIGAPLPKWLAGRLLNALQDLEYGEVQALLRPERVKREKAMDDLKARALDHVNYYHGRGHSYEEACVKVSEAYEIEEDTIKKWKIRLRNSLGEQAVEDRANMHFDNGKAARNFIERNGCWPSRDPVKQRWSSKSEMSI